MFQAKSFLGETDLMAQFREMVGWEERGGGGGGGSGAGSSGYNGIGTSNDDKTGARQAVKPNKVDLSIQYGPSYRRLPPSVSNNLPPFLSPFLSAVVELIYFCLGDQGRLLWPRCIL